MAIRASTLVEQMKQRRPRNKAGLAAVLALAVLAMAGCGASQPADSAAVLIAPPEYPPPPAAASEAIKGQLELLHSPDALERAEAVRMLGELGGEASPAVGYLVVALADPHPQVRRNAAEALGRIRDPQAVEPLVTVMEQSDEDWGVRARAAAALGELGDPRATEALAAALADMVSHVRLPAAVALGQIGDPAAAEPLDSAARLDPDLGVRQAAREALQKLPPADRGHPATYRE